MLAGLLHGYSKRFPSALALPLFPRGAPQKKVSQAQDVSVYLPRVDYAVRLLKDKNGKFSLPTRMSNTTRLVTPEDPQFAAWDAILEDSQSKRLFFLQISTSDPLAHDRDGVTTDRILSSVLRRPGKQGAASYTLPFSFAQLYPLWSALLMPSSPS